MKNKLMERPLMGGIVRQLEANQMLCLTDLSNISRAESARTSPYRFDLIFASDSGIEFIADILDLQNAFINTDKSIFIENVGNQGLIKSLKDIGQYKVTGRGSNKAIYCNPYIFAAIASFLNDMLFLAVSSWLLNKTIIDRIKVGSRYNDLCNAVAEKTLPNAQEKNRSTIFSDFAILVNKKVCVSNVGAFNRIISKTQASELDKIQTKLAALIEVGYVKDYEGAKRYLEL